MCIGMQKLRCVLEEALVVTWKNIGRGGWGGVGVSNVRTLVYSSTHTHTHTHTYVWIFVL